MYIDNVWGILDQIQGPGGKEGFRALFQKIQYDMDIKYNAEYRS